MRLHVERLFGRWCASVWYRGHHVEAYAPTRGEAIREAVLHAMLEVLN